MIKMMIVTPWAKPSATGVGLTQDSFSKDGKPINDFINEPEVVNDGVNFFTMNRGSDEALCFDLRANVDVTLGRGQQAKIPTGVHIAMPPYMGCLMRERSGLADRGLRLGAGTLDADYRGEYKVLLRYEPCVDILDPLRKIPDTFTIFKGDRIVQMMFTNCGDASLLRWKVLSSVTELPGSLRGVKGFGSTGMS